MKPSPTLFREAFAAFDVHPSEILFAGDSLKRDVKPAKALGLATAWINRQAADSGIREKVRCGLHHSVTAVFVIRGRTDNLTP